MSNLPSEILHEAFIRLPLKQRLECMFVCRQWYHVLSGQSLLYDIELDSDSKFNNFMDMVQRFYSRASQVEILKIRRILKKSFDNRKFCNMFPNLRVFTFVSCAGSDSVKCFFDRPFELMLRDTKLEEIKDSHYCELARQLITTGSCTKLKELELDLCYVHNPRQNIYVHMKNTPVLTKLTLFFCTIGIQDCEILHSNLPTLQVFDLDDVILDPGKLPKNIEPATSVTKLLIDIAEVVNYIEHPNWYIYMTKKYTNLESFVCSDFAIQDIDLGLTTIIYRDGIIPLYKNIRKRQFCFVARNMPTELDVFKQLDDFGCRFSLCKLEHNGTRPIFSQLALSNLAKYIKKLEIENSIITSPSLFQNMRYLTTLNIDTDEERGYWPIDLTEYLDAFPPTLVDFSIYCTDLEISKLPTRQSEIEKLHIKCNIISEELVNLISDFFPELYNLDLRGGIPKNMTMDFTPCCLLNLTIAAYYEEVPHCFSVHSTDGSPVKHYVGNPKVPWYDPEHLDPATAEDLQDRIVIELKHTAENLLLSTASFDDIF